MVFEGIRGDLRLAQVILLEAVAVDDQDAIGFQVGDVDFQRRRVHGDQNIDGVAGSVNFVGGKMQLESADAGDGPGRGADFRGVVREGGNVIAVERHGVRKLIAGNLHAVTGIARKANDRLIDNLALVLYWWNFYERRHFLAQASAFQELPGFPNGSAARLKS